jgi:hypothetical protein
MFPIPRPHLRRHRYRIHRRKTRRCTPLSQHRHRSAIRHGPNLHWAFARKPRRNPSGGHPLFECGVNQCWIGNG